MAAATVRPYAPFSSQSGLRVPALEAAGIKLTEITPIKSFTKRIAKPAVPLAHLNHRCGSRGSHRKARQE